MEKLREVRGREPAAERFMSWSNWRALLVAYGVHHAAGVAGLLTARLIAPDTWIRLFPFHHPIDWLRVLAFVPLWDVMFVVEVVAVNINLPGMVFLCVRCLAVLTIPVAIMAYGVSRRSVCLWYLGIVSFLIFLSITYSAAAGLGIIRSSP